MPPTGFEPTISEGKRPQTLALDRAATVTGLPPVSIIHNNCLHYVSITMLVAGTPSASACRPDAYPLTCPAVRLLPVATLLSGPFAHAALLTTASRLHTGRSKTVPPNPWPAVNLLPATQCYVVRGDTCIEKTSAGHFSW